MKKRNLVISESKQNVMLTTILPLQEIRESALRQHFDINKTIAELDELASEINATLAFLRAKRGDK